MGTSLLFFGFLFLINPELLTLDVFPDWIGYLLIAFGLSKLACLEERIASARRWALFLALSSAVQMATVPMVFTAQFESDRLMFSFAFLVAGVWLSLLFCDNLFRGVQYLAVRQDSNLALKGYEVAKSYVMVFFIAKYALNFLPQLATLVFPKVDASPDEVENYTQLRTLFEGTRSILFLLGTVVLLVLGIYTARIVRAYWKRIRSDADFCKRLRGLYDEKVTNNPSMQSRLAIRGAFSWFFIAPLFLADLYLDGINVIPSFLFSLFVFFGLKRIKRQVSLSPAARKVPLISAAIGLVAYILRLSVSHPAVGIATGALFGLSMILVAYYLMEAVFRVAAKFTEYSYGRYRILLFISFLIQIVMGILQHVDSYLFSALLFPQIALCAVSAYFNKKSLDEIGGEAEYRLM